MLPFLKLTIASGLAWTILNPSFTPGSETCECKAKAAVQAMPRADTCECKAKALAPVVPHADTCECKARTP
jgi:hypothetical protein